MHATVPSPAPAKRWRAPPLLKASAACHLGAAALVATAPALWPWALGAVALDHALLTATGLWPRSTWLGANLLRLPDAASARGEVAVTLDDGPDPAVTPQVLDILDAHGARATFFCIAEQAARHPLLAREIVRRGHSVQNHSLRHRHNFSLLGPAGLKREIGQAQDRLAQLTDQRPSCFRAPAGLRNLFLDPVLHALDLRLVSWTRRGFDTREADPQTVLARLTQNLAAGDIVLLHDRHGAAMADGRPVVLQALPLLLARLRGAGLSAVTLPEALNP
ncbi:polysaccharide deacetylase family protein [Pseudorhodoferax sp.]|uniref:polysaccharide deacetylase family protein n=1 Tax=Pseudorhodoferax sp. TaxID=1993553 RepID=UPI002DD656FB|nr:polysaccharide deacetylase family protein [Pseudorhodoferax sp.]